MPAFVEVLSVIVRQGPEAREFGDDYIHAVAGSSVDGRTMVLKALTEGIEPPSRQAVVDVVQAIEALGLEAHWERKRDMVDKKTIPHPDHAKEDAEHFAAAKHAIEQIEHGHYGVKDVSISQVDNADGSVTISATFTRFEINPTIPAAPHA